MSWRCKSEDVRRLGRNIDKDSEERRKHLEATENSTVSMGMEARVQ